MVNSFITNFLLGEYLEDLQNEQLQRAKRKD